MEYQYIMLSGNIAPKLARALRRPRVLIYTSIPGWRLWIEPVGGWD